MLVNLVVFIQPNCEQNIHGNFFGFEEEVVEQLNEIYRDRFEKNHRNLGIYFHKKQAELKGKPELIATLQLHEEHRRSIDPERQVYKRQTPSHIIL